MSLLWFWNLLAPQVHSERWVAVFIRCFFIRCLFICCLFIRCLFILCLFTRCLLIRCLFLRCLFIRCLFVRCLFICCLFISCLFIRCLFIRCLFIRSTRLTGQSAVLHASVMPFFTIVPQQNSSKQLKHNCSQLMQPMGAYQSLKTSLRFSYWFSH